MVISEAIKQLQEILEKEGDLEICSFDEFDGMFRVSLDKTFEIIEIDYEDEPTTTKLCGLMDIFEELEPEKPKLTVVK